MCSCGILTTNIVILIGLCVTGTYGMARQCISGTDIVPVCSNVTTATNQMFIPVNGSIDTGCICGVQFVQVPSNTRYPVHFRGVDINNTNCGYQMDVVLDTGDPTISCSADSSLEGSLGLWEFYRLRFTRDSTPNPPPTAGFCLHVDTRTPGVQFIMICVNINIPTATETPQSTTRKATMSSQQTTETSSSTVLSPITNTQSGNIYSQKTTRSADDTPTGTSTTTVQSSNKVTDNMINKKLPVAAIGGGIGGAVLLLIVIIVIVILCKSRRNNNYDQPSDRITESTNYSNLRAKDEMVIMDNNLYVSYNHDKNQSTTPPTSGLQPEEGHTYANTNGRVLPEANHFTPDLQNAEGHTYTNIDEQQPSQTNHSTSNQHHAQPSVTTADYKSTHDDMIILENDLYVSADSIPDTAAIENNKQVRNEQLNQTGFAQEQTPCVNNVYAVVNKNRKPINKPENI